ncbi:MAG: hypothetical protein LBR05_03175 [Azoarcus sp.]|nr:hypothetical protein [Azoarcus sp.]
MKQTGKLAAPKAGEIVRLEYTRMVRVRDEQIQPATPKRGKMNYLGGPVRKGGAERKSAFHKVEKTTVTCGRYVRDGAGRVIAFVMADPDEASEYMETNEQERQD